MRLPAIRAVLRSQIQIAAGGNVRAQRAILTMVKDLESDRAVDTRLGNPVPPLMVDDADDHHDDDFDYDVDAAGDDGDSAGEPARADEIGTDVERRQDEKRAQFARPPSSADSTRPPETAAALPVNCTTAKSSTAKSSTAKSSTEKSPPASGGRPAKGAAARSTASRRDTPSKRCVRRERGRAAARKAPPAPAAAPGPQAGGTPALRPSA